MKRFICVGTHVAVVRLNPNAFCRAPAIDFLLKCLHPLIIFPRTRTVPIHYFPFALTSLVENSKSFDTSPPTWKAPYPVLCRALPLSLRFVSLCGLLRAFRSSKTSNTSNPVLKQVLKGRKSYRVLKSLTPCVFQAKVEGGSDLYIQLNDPNFYANTSQGCNKNTSSRNCGSVPRRGEVAERVYVPLNLYLEYIENPNNRCLVLEWMDNTLWETKDEPMEDKVGVFKIVTTFAAILLVSKTLH